MIIFLTAVWVSLGRSCLGKHTWSNYLTFFRDIGTYDAAITLLKNGKASQVLGRYDLGKSYEDLMWSDMSSLCFRVYRQEGGMSASLKWQIWCEESKKILVNTMSKDDIISIESQFIDGVNYLYICNFFNFSIFTSTFLCLHTVKELIVAQEFCYVFLDYFHIYINQWAEFTCSMKRNCGIIWNKMYLLEIFEENVNFVHCICS